MMPPQVPIPFLRRRLLAWFDLSQRDVPWRHDRDPYRIWVSEVMLQQTTVATVKSRFLPFLAAFPTVAALAAASEQEVLRAWEGLGYYRRARNLHAAARQLVADHGGQLPDNPTVWSSLPGVGRYMVGAVLSQAFERRLPVVEANSQRVLCRLFGEAGNPANGSVRRWLWETATKLLPRKRVGDFNQALMELGALVCTPAKPRCGDCPLARACVARQRGVQDSIPARAAEPKRINVREVAIVVRRQGRVLLVKRPGHGRWSNMWEFPHGELQRDEAPAEGAAYLLKSLTGVAANIGPEIMTLRHGVMHYRITMTCLESDYSGGRFASPFYAEGRWLRPQELQELPVSSPQRKLADEITRPVRQRRLF